MVLLDSSFLIDIMHNASLATNMFKELKENKTEFFVSPITIMEVWAGALESRKTSDSQRAKIDEFIANMNIIPFNIKEAKKAAEIEYELSKKGITIEIED